MTTALKVPDGIDGVFRRGCLVMVLMVLMAPLPTMAWERTVTIRSQGADNQTWVDQSASYGASLIQIDQVADSAGVNQAGLMEAPIRQTGEAQRLILNQDAREAYPGAPVGNRFSADQSGQGMQMGVSQTGGGNEASVVQGGEVANVFEIQQSGQSSLKQAVQESGSEGAGLSASVRQSGGGRIDALSQSGNDNVLDIRQEKTMMGGELVLEVSQSGQGNRLDVTQQTNEGSASLSQSGQDHQLSVTQNQALNGLSVRQTGVGANVSIYTSAP